MPYVDLTSSDITYRFWVNHAAQIPPIRFSSERIRWLLRKDQETCTFSERCRFFSFHVCNFVKIVFISPVRLIGELVIIFHSCEVRTEISVSKVAFWHHEASPLTLSSRNTGNVTAMTQGTVLVKKNLYSTDAPTQQYDRGPCFFLRSQRSLQLFIGKS